MKSFLGEKRINNYVFLMMIIILQIVFITYFFAVKKNGYHSDEIWNYGFANSSDCECIYMKDGEVINAYGWVDSSVLLKYISVDESEIFDYKSVYENAAKDLNPPLQYFLLHTISSIRTNTWSKWYCYIINILSFIITQLFLYKTLETISDKASGIAGVVLFGFCVGGMNITIYLRLYALGVAFSMMFFYYSVKLWTNRHELKKSDLIKLLLVAVAGCLTIHQFLIFAFAVTLFYSFCYLIKKDYKMLFLYGGISLAAVLASIAVFPYALSHMSGYSGTDSNGKISVIYQFGTYVSYLCRDIMGIFVSLTPTATQSVIGLILSAVIALVLVVCFFSKEKEWYKNIKCKIKDRLAVSKKRMNKTGVVLLSAAFVCVFLIGICSVNTNVVVMGLYTKRYLFLIYPIFTIVLVLLLDLIADKKALFVLTLFFALLSNCLSDKAFLFDFKGDEDVFDKIEENAYCIVVLKDLWLMTCAVNELYDTDMFYLTDRDNYKADNYASISDETSVYLLLDVSDEREIKEDSNDDLIDTMGYFSNKEDFLAYYSGLTICNKIEFIGTDYLFDRKIEVYKLR